MISYTALKSEVVARLGNRTDIDGRVDRWINHAFFEILLNPRFGFYELDASYTFGTDGVTEEYAIPNPTQVWFILDIRDMTNQRKLRRSHWNLIDRIQQTTGQPFRYYRFENNLILDPVADDGITLQVRYRTRPSDFAPGSTLLNLGTEWEEPVLELATIKGFTALSQPEKAGPHKEILEALFATRMDVPTLEAGDDENTIGVTLSPTFAA